MEIILATRYGGLGDLIMMLPTLRALRTKHPGARLVLRTYKDYVGYVDHMVDQVILDDNRNQLFACNLPIRGGPNTYRLGQDNQFAQAGDVIYHYNFQGVIESRQDIHGVLTFAEAAGVDLGTDWEPVLPMPEKPYTVVQLRDNRDGRGLSRGDLPDKFLLRSDVRVIDEPLTPSQYLELIAGAECFVGPDSSGLHIAAATGVPRIFGLYNIHFPPRIRAYGRVRAFTDKMELKKELERMGNTSTCPICGATAHIKTEAYWNCPACDAWYQDPMPPKIFEAAEEKGPDGRSNGHNQPESDLKHSAHLADCFAHNWIKRIPLPEGRQHHKAIDIGCKYPYFAHTLKKNHGIEAYGIDGMDFDADQAPILSQYSAELGIPMLMVDFERVTPEQILEKTETKDRFDAISMVHVFEHMYQPYEALKNLRQMIRDEGYFLIRVPSHEVPGMEWHMSERHYTIHPFFYSEKSMRTLIDKSGLFQIIETYPMPAGTRDYILKPI